MKLEDVKKELLNQPFKTVFKATLGFYAAQAVIGALQITLIGILFIACALIIK